MRITTKLAAAALSALCLAGVAACSGSDDKGSQGQQTQETEQSPAQRLAAAKSFLDSATSVHLLLKSYSVPKDAKGVVAAEGSATHPPAFKGTFKVSISGVQADAEVVSVGGETYAKLPFTTALAKIDPKTFGLPDPAVLFSSSDKGISTLLTAAQQPLVGDKVRRGGEVLTTFKGSIPGKAVTDMFLIGDPNGTFQAAFLLTDTNELREVRIDGPWFGAGSAATYTLTLDKYGEAVTITKP